jgi:predicted PurR-regulated permease PerM
MTRVDDGDGRQTVQVEGTNLAETVITSTRTFIAGVIIVVALLYFLLAYGDVLASKIVQLSSSGRAISAAARAAEGEISAYLFTITLINAGLGVAVGGAMALLGMPNPVLWGVMAAVLNFIPYIGAMTGIAIVAVVALLTFDDPGRAALPPLCYFVLTGLEGQFLTPTILGYRLRLNPVVIFLWLVLWTWLWGVPGALLAVPILTGLKIVCDQVESLRPLGELITR